MIITANIVRPTVTTNFTVLPNALLEYNRHATGLKPRDMAVLNYLLSKPEIWKVRAQDIANAINIGKSTVYKALRRLQDFGFASYTRDKKGFTFWTISCPEKLCEPAISAHVKKPHVAFDNALTSNNLLKNIKRTTNDIVEKASFVVKANFVKPIIAGPAPVPASKIEIEQTTTAPSKISIESPISLDECNAAMLPGSLETINAIDTSVKIFNEIINEATDALNDIEQQLNPKERIIAKKALAKVPDATQFIIVSMLKAALLKGGVKSPMGYLNALVNKSITGELDITAFTTDKISIPANDIERQALRETKIRRVFDKHQNKIKTDLIAQGYVSIDGLGPVSKSEFENLGLIDKAPRTINSGGKSLSLSELMDIAEKQALAQAAAREKQNRADAAYHKGLQPREVADIKVGVMTEKEIATRKMILELEAQLIAAGEFTGANAKAISDNEIAELAELEAMETTFLS